MIHHSNIHEQIIRVNGMGANPSSTQTIDFVIEIVNHATLTLTSLIAPQEDHGHEQMFEVDSHILFLQSRYKKSRLSVFIF
jgi:hypothetical protein